MPRITLESKEVSGFSEAGHLYLVYRLDGEINNSGKILTVHPGSGTSGFMVVNSGIETKSVSQGTEVSIANSRDAYSLNMTESERLALDIFNSSNGDNVIKIWEKLQAMAQEIQDAQFNYHGLSGPNSNSFITSLLSSLNIDVNVLYAAQMSSYSLFGMPGSSSLVSGSGGDTLRGFGENDTFYDKGGNDIFSGGDDSDISEESGNLVDTTDGLDTVDYVYAGETTNTIKLDVHDSYIRAEDGREGVDELYSIEIVKGKIGSTATFENYSGSINASFVVDETHVLTTAITTSSGALLQFIDFNCLTGSNQNDTMKVFDYDISYTQSVSFHGGGGNDTLSGGNGDDEIYGGTGRDILVGGAGNDVLDGGSEEAGAAAVNDMADYRNAGAGITQIITPEGVETVSGSATGTDTLQNIEQIVGSEYSDNFSLPSQAIFFNGRGGTDTFDASAIAGSLQFNLASKKNANGSVTSDLAYNWSTGQWITLYDMEIIKGGMQMDHFIVQYKANYGDVVERLDGGAGYDTLYFDDSNPNPEQQADKPQKVFLEIDRSTMANNATIRLENGVEFKATNFESFIGSSVNDLFIASGDAPAGSSPIVLNGGAGNDLISISAGTTAEPASYLVYGGAGNDIFRISEKTDVSIQDYTAEDVLFMGKNNLQPMAELYCNMNLGEDFDAIAYISNPSGDIEAGDVNGLRYQLHWERNIETGQISGWLVISGPFLQGADYNTIRVELNSIDMELSPQGARFGNIFINFGFPPGYIPSIVNDGYIIQEGNPGYPNLSPAKPVSSNDGTSGDDIQNTGSTGGSMNGGEGNDTQIGGEGDDTSYAGSGNDIVMTGGGSDTVIAGGGEGDDYYDGGAGTDVIKFESTALGVTVDLLAGTADGSEIGHDRILDIENVVGGSGNDTLTGTSRSNILNGGSGDDTLNGGAGDDTLIGGSGADTLTGGDGNDLLKGGYGADTMDGGNGEDSFVGGAGNDLFIGGAGIDVADYSAGTAGILANLSSTSQTINGVTLAAGTVRDDLGGIDTLTGVEKIYSSVFADYLIGSNEADVLNGNSGNDTIDGGAGDDTLKGGAGNDLLIGGSGIDVADYSAGTAGILANLSSTSQTINGVTLAAGTVRDDLGGIDTLTGVEKIYSSVFADYLIGSNEADVLNGNSGNDTIDGGAGDDTLKGGAGNDLLIGGSGIDVADYSAGVAGILANLSSASQTINGVTLAAGTVRDDLGGIDTLTGVEKIYSSVFADYLIGSNGADVLNGNAGNDTLAGGTGRDTLKGGEGSDRYLYNLGDGADTIMENDTTAGNTDVVNFGSGIGQQCLWFSQSGNNLIVNVMGTADSITVSNWYSGSAYDVEQFATNDGMKLDSQLAQLVTAMASYAASNSGFNPTSATVMPTDTTLQTAIAAAWHA